MKREVENEDSDPEDEEEGEGEEGGDHRSSSRSHKMNHQVIIQPPI